MIAYRTLDPSTGELVEEFPLASERDIESALDSTVVGYRANRRRSFDDRAKILNAAADELERSAGELAELMALEMGKPRAQGKAEAEKCAWVCRYYAEHAAEQLRSEQRPSDGAEAWVRFEPLGVVLAIMPWNFPLWQLFRFAAPALAAGNAVVLKHAPNTPRCALAIEDLFSRIGEPALLRNLFLDNDQAARVLGDPRIAAVTLTGSARAGRAVAAIAGQHLKPSVLELGGSDPFLVLDDADLERAVAVGVTSRCLNNGQSCIAAKRFLVHTECYPRFREAFVEAMRVQKIGRPLEPKTQIGPLARADLRDTLDQQVQAATAQGARALCGGEPLSGEGFFYPPTVLEGVTEAMDAYRDELFGPVAVLLRVDSDEQAIAVANATPFGLGASVWTRDRSRAERFARDLDCGAVFINGLVKSDPRLPFGGVKESGYGRELSLEGIREFVNVKTVWHA